MPLAAPSPPAAARSASPFTAYQIGEAAEQSGVSAKMIRYYESVGLIRPATRSSGNYRTYDHRAVQTLRFIARARELGFGMDEIAKLLALWQQPGRSSAEVKAVAMAHMATLDQKIRALQSMSAALKHLTDHCHGDQWPDCPILADLADDGKARTRGAAAWRRHHE